MWKSSRYCVAQHFALLVGPQLLRTPCNATSSPSPTTAALAVEGAICGFFDFFPAVSTGSVTSRARNFVGEGAPWDFSCFISKSGVQNKHQSKLGAFLKKIAKWTKQQIHLKNCYCFVDFPQVGKIGEPKGGCLRRGVKVTSLPR